MRLGLIGRSIGYSRSPELYKAFSKRDTIDIQYHLIELSTIHQVQDILQHGHFSGLNVTIPYKKKIIPYLDDLSAEAQAIQAVNCITRSKGHWTGHNTDIDGVRASLDSLGIHSSDRALLFGTGGASQAVQYVLNERNIEYRVVSRRETFDTLAYGQINREILHDHRLLIQCTPLGTYPEIQKKITLPYSHLTENHILFDLVYTPEITAFMQEGIDRGARVLGGMMMLKKQAESAWKKWNQTHRR